MAGNIFKILARSTKLSKSSKLASNSTDQKFPSSGEPAHPQIFGQGRQEGVPEEVPVASFNGNKKRKRGQVDPSETLPTELDFFGDGSKGNKHRKAEAVSEDTQTQIQPNGHGRRSKEQVGSSPLTVDPMSEEQRRAVLKAHKIKVAVLENWAPAEEVAASESKRKKRKSRKEPELETAALKKQKNKKEKVQLYPHPLMRFEDLRARYNISKRLAENIEEQGYSAPTEVQMASIPLLLGDVVRRESDAELAADLLAVAPTGSGKTLAFLIPMMDAILRTRRHESAAATSVEASQGPLAIVLAPTKELASQIVNEGRKLAARTGLKVTLMKKGMCFSESDLDVDSDEDEPEESGAGSESDDDQAPGPSKSPRKNKKTLVKSHIVVSTPLTLLHAMTVQDTVRPLPTVQHLILDEADVLLHPMFRTQTLSIWSACSKPSLSSTLWSATMGSNIEALARVTLGERPASPPRKPLVRLVIGLKDSVLPTISHRLVYAANEAGKRLALRQLLSPSAPSSSDSKEPRLRPPFLVFMQSISRAVALAAEFRYAIPESAGGSTRIATLHADMSDARRDAVMARFRKGEIWVLITTDLLARGVDFRGVNGVVNYDVPTSSAAYVHRVGRTGRAGREGGVAVTLYTEEDVPFIRGVANVIAASERGNVDGGIQSWMFDKLPVPTKREKQRLKMRGVEARRPGNESAKTRITTKSGYDMKLERRRKDAIERARSKNKGRAVLQQSKEESESEGFDD